MEWTKFQELIKDIFSRMPELNFTFDSEKITFYIYGNTYSYTVEEYDAVLSNLESYDNKATYIHRKNDVEFLLTPISQRSFRRYYEEGISISDESFSYNLTTPSQEMILAFLSTVSEIGISSFRRPGFFRGAMQDLEDERAEIGLFDLITNYMHIYYSLKICSKYIMPIDVFQDFANSFLFNLSYNTGNVFKIITDISEMEINRRHTRSRHLSSMSEMDTPKLFYKPELIEQYNLASSTNDPFIEFLAYYHIMEYFFEDVRDEAVMNGVKEILQRPGFSANKPKELSKIINSVKKNSKEGTSGKEQEELELTINSYVNPEQLYEDICDYDQSLIEYYRDNDVHFSKGDKVNLEDYANGARKLARRIYKTRNALVHNKSNEARVEE